MMNLRIQELWRDCVVKHTKDPMNWQLVANEFAELIVRECAKVLTQHGAYFSGDGEPYHYAASLIEEHFGVE
jgi:hypothetical protein